MKTHRPHPAQLDFITDLFMPPPIATLDQRIALQRAEAIRTIAATDARIAAARTPSLEPAAPFPGASAGPYRPGVELDPRPTIAPLPAWPLDSDPDPRDADYCADMLDHLGDEMRLLTDQIGHLTARLEAGPCRAWSDEIAACAEYLEPLEAEYAYWYQAWQTFHSAPLAA